MSELNLSFRPELRRPVLVAAFRGWNDGGQGASLGADRPHGSPNGQRDHLLHVERLRQVHGHIDRHLESLAGARRRQPQLRALQGDAHKLPEVVDQAALQRAVRPGHPAIEPQDSQRGAPVR